MVAPRREVRDPRFARGGHQPRAWIQFERDLRSLLEHPAEHFRWGVQDRSRGPRRSTAHPRDSGTRLHNEQFRPSPRYLLMAFIASVSADRGGAVVYGGQAAEGKGRRHQPEAG